jgi:hypothetical protein
MLWRAPRGDEAAMIKIPIIEPYGSAMAITTMDALVDPFVFVRN